ncbi:uncharacterized protein LOC123563761 [Mercenaria mercenaria]|uniref:uncharacterized protein LOC123563761 n=1 Tax=Mercenaria mercenaria TaxID=6596 RepID=UPI00234ECDF7|nr:uncharacterized protein LOC123563761 [Mercenaria mercenaria]
MCITLSGVFVTILFSSQLTTAESGLDTKYGHFQVLQKQNHPGLRKCADAIMKKNEYVGGRVSQLTSECHGLSYSWGLNQTMKSGYAYLKKTFVQENFQPALKVECEPVTWTIPGVFSPGAKLDVLISLPGHDAFGGGVVFILTETIGDFTDKSTTLTFKLEGRSAYLSENNTKRDLCADPLGQIYIWPVSKLAKGMCKISFLAHTDSVTILADDEVFHTYRSKRVLDTKRQISINELPTKSDVFLHRIQFTAN